MLQFNNASISVSGVKMLCQSALVSESNSTSPIYGIGYRGNLAMSPNGPIKNSVSLSYFVEPASDIGYGLSNAARTYDTTPFPTQIVVANKTGMGYLTSYSLNIAPNEPIQASAQYDIFTEMTGEFGSQSRLGFHSGNFSGVGHYWTTYAKKINNSNSGSVLQCSYSINMEWLPVYKVGSPNPVQVKLLGIKEDYNFTTEYSGIKVTHSGRKFSTTFSDFDVIEVNPLSNDWGITGAKMTLYPSGGRVMSNRVSLQENGLILNETNVVKYY